MKVTINGREFEVHPEVAKIVELKLKEKCHECFLKQVKDVEDAVILDEPKLEV